LNNPLLFLKNIIANKLIIKSVRLNRLLPWIIKRLSIKETFLIIRHPCAVINSQIKTGYTAYHPNIPPYIDIIPKKKEIINEAQKIEGIDDEIVNKLKKIQTPEEILASIWCLDNVVPLLLSDIQKKFKLVVYEKMIIEDKKVIFNILKSIQEEKNLKYVLSRMKIPSKVTKESEKKIIENGEKQLSKWKKSLTNKQIDNILKIVSIFDMDFYSNEIEPDYNLMKKNHLFFNKEF
jgi:hypothetical protein